MKYDIKSELLKEAKYLDCLNHYYIEVGVVSEDEDKAHIDKEGIKLDITNAQLMYFHENGSIHFPARPVLQMTIDYANTHLVNKIIDTCIDGVFNKKWKEEQIVWQLEKLCNKMQNYARKLIYSNDGRLAPNSPSTEKAKGFNHPLFETGRLARSIVCRLVKK